MNPHAPLHAGHGGWAEGSLSMLPYVSTFFLVLLLAALGAFYLRRQGTLSMPRLSASRSPEDEAKRILAERFARGDISTEDFMERSSVLNWSTDALPPSTRRRQR